MNKITEERKAALLKKVEAARDKIYSLSFHMRRNGIEPGMASQTAFRELDKLEQKIQSA